MDEPEPNEVVKDCRECHGMGFHLSPYRGPDKPRTKKNCAVCDGRGIRIFRRRRSPESQAAGAVPGTGSNGTH